MVIGGINVTESARAAGDDYSTRDILLTEAFSTLVAGVCGGVAQTTPYIGQPAYKKMGARAGYTLLTGVFVGLGGIFGYLSNLVELVPLAVLAPILVFVSIDITAQAFDATPRRHAAAVVLAFFPADRADARDQARGPDLRLAGALLPAAWRRRTTACRSSPSSWRSATASSSRPWSGPASSWR